MSRFTAELTAAERRIARRAARGERNGEIAAAVGLSVRTVEWYLSRVYRKFGLRSRTELAVFAAARDRATREDGR